MAEIMENLQNNFSKLNLENEDLIDSELPWDIIKTFFEGKHFTTISKTSIRIL